MTEFMVYSKPQCPQCDQAKQLLEMKGYEYKVASVGTDLTREEFIEMFPNARSFPVVLDGSDFIGGVNELRTYIQNKDLGEMTL